MLFGRMPSNHSRTGSVRSYFRLLLLAIVILHANCFTRNVPNRKWASSYVGSEHGDRTIIRADRGTKYDVTKRSKSTHVMASMGEISEKLRGGAMAGNVRKMYSSYMDVLDRKPVITKSVTAAVVSVLGDWLAQWLEAKLAGNRLILNWVRLGAFFLCGLVYVGPFVHVWYEQLWKLGRWMKSKYNSSKNLQILAQVITDQTVGVAIFFPSYFYVYEFLEAIVARRGKYGKGTVSHYYFESSSEDLNCLPSLFQLLYFSLLRPNVVSN